MLALVTGSETESVFYGESSYQVASYMYDESSLSMHDRCIYSTPPTKNQRDSVASESFLKQARVYWIHISICLVFPPQREYRYCSYYNSNNIYHCPKITIQMQRDDGIVNKGSDSQYPSPYRDF